MANQCWDVNVALIKWYQSLRCLTVCCRTRENCMYFQKLLLGGLRPTGSLWSTCWRPLLYTVLPLCYGLCTSMLLYLEWTNALDMYASIDIFKHRCDVSSFSPLQVSLKFSSLQELPGEKTSLSLQAHPGSLCSLRAIDQSVLLLQPEQELSLDSVRSPWFCIPNGSLCSALLLTRASLLAVHYI